MPKRTDWPTYFDTRKPDGTFPYPYGTEDGEPYIFPLEDFPTEEAVRAWFKWTGDEDPDDPWDIARGTYPIHDHDEDFDCPGGDDCPQARNIEGWWAG